MIDTNDDEPPPRRRMRDGGPRDKARPAFGKGPGKAFAKGPGAAKGYGKGPGGGAKGPGKPHGARGGGRAERAPRHEAEAPAEVLPTEERIAKVIARAGIASRRDAEAMIEAGRVTLNGAPVTSPAINVGLDDAITVDGDPLPSRERTRLWLFHKPRGLVTTFRDPEGRPTVFDSLPEEMPRVVAIGRLDINTEGLLLLTNDGGLAKVIAHPETGWTRRYRARARGEVTQAQLDRLRGGITIDGMEYGPVEAMLDRVQGDNSWISISLREGKNREVKRILEHLGLQVNRLIRLSFGPFQLGEIEQGLVEEIRTKVLKEQLGEALAAEAGADFESPVRTPIAAFGKPARMQARPPRSRNAALREDRGRPDRAGPGFARPGFERPGRGASPERGERRTARPKEREERGRDLVWRADDEARPPRPPRHQRREDPKAEREASAARPRSRGKPIDGGDGRRIRVERIVAPAAEEAPRHRRDRSGRPPREEAESPRRPAKDWRGGSGDGRPKRPAGPGGKRPGPGGRPPSGGRPSPGGRPRPGGRPGSRPPRRGGDE